jgi:uncharacterized C2H2 Zn-finger protein
MRSILKVPIKVEMQPVEHMSDHVLTVDELASQIEEARKGKAKVDNSYVGYQDAGHLFEYKYDYVRYLESMAHILKEARARPQPERYKNKREMIIQ